MIAVRKFWWGTLCYTARFNLIFHAIVAFNFDYVYIFLHSMTAKIIMPESNTIGTYKSIKGNLIARDCVVYAKGLPVEEHCFQENLPDI